MYSQSFVVAAAVAALSTSTYAQLPNVDPFLSSTLPTECKNAASGSFISFAFACVDAASLTTVLSSSNATSGSNSPLLNLFGSASFLNSFCSKSCLDAGDQFQRSLETVCGNNVLVAPSLVPANTTAPMTAANINNYVKNINAVGCIKTDDGSKYCEVEIFDYLKKNNVPYNFDALTQTFIRDSNFSCSSCVKREVGIAANATTWVDYQRFKPFIDSLTQVTAKCPATTTTNTTKTNGANPSGSFTSMTWIGLVASSLLTVFAL